MMPGFRGGQQRAPSPVPAFLFLAASAVIFLSGGCSESAPLEIGFAGGLSGRVADLGISGRNGAALAVEERNRAGGINGRPVKLIVRDDEQDGSTALRVDRELVGRGIEAIIGHMTSSMTMAAVDFINGSDAILVSPTTTTTYLSGRDDHFLRVNATTKEYAAKMARYLSRLGLRSVVVIYDLRNRAYTESWFENFRAEFLPLGGAVTAVESYTSGPRVHFSEVVNRALSGDAEGLVIIASAMDTAMFCQQVRKEGRTVPVAAAEWAATETLVEMGGTAVEGIIVSQFFDRNSKLPRYVAFRNAYRDRFGEEPGFASVNAYDAATVVLEAFEKRQKGEALKDAILRISTFPGVQGPVTIDRYGDAERKTFITTVSGGHFRVLE